MADTVCVRSELRGAGGGMMTTTMTPVSINLVLFFYRLNKSS